MTNLIKWPEIQLFHNLLKTVEFHPEILQESKCVSYKAKPKLHGSNLAVQLHSSGEIITQTREKILSPNDDYKGFDAWVRGNKGLWLQFLDPEYELTTVFGEWVGPGINKSDVAINKLPEKVFAVFAILRSSSETSSEDFVVNPEDFLFLEAIPRLHVLPWFGKEFNLNLLNPASLEFSLKEINKMVEVMEQEDIWVQNKFQIQGPGEGFVFYPVSHPGKSSFANLAFKAKGEKHQVIKAKEAVQISTEVANSIQEFVKLVVTPARLEQGLSALNLNSSQLENKNLGKFLNWISQDVEKETKNELQAAKLTWKQVQKEITAYAKAWYQKQVS